MTRDSTPKAPLANLTVLDLTRNLAGPYCTMILGDLGARVIKIERPGTGDDTRDWRPPDWQGRSAFFEAINRNKESLAIDIDHEVGAEVVRRLAAKADILVQSFRGTSLAKRGLTFEQLKTVNPRIVYCSLNGFGARGPEAERAGYDALVQAYTGIMSITGERGRGPVRVGPSIIDMGSGHWAAFGIMTALRLRDLTGEAQNVETSLLETGVAWMSYYIAGYFGDGTVAKANGTRQAMIAPYEDFKTKDGAIYLAAPNESLFRKLCRAIGRPALPEDPRFASNPVRLKNRDALHDEIEVALKAKTATEWEQLLIKEGLPCSRIQGVDGIARDPQVEALGMIRPFKHHEIADMRLVDHPVSYNGTRAFSAIGAPPLGGHTRKILGELGYPTAEIDKLAKAGVVTA